MTDGTQHSQGQKALLDLESRFTLKKTSAYGINGMQLKVLALFPRLFEDYPYPVVVTAAILKLADWFRQSNNVIKFHIYKVFQQSSEAHLPKLINTEETVRRILPVLTSNDFLARSITLRIVQRLQQASEKSEIEAAIWAADRFCAESHRFMTVICSETATMINRDTIQSDIKKQLVCILRHMHGDISLSKKAKDMCMPLLSSDSPDAQVFKAVLDTLTSLSSHSLLGRSEHIDLLISCACTDAREEIKCHALNNLVQLQDGQIGLKKRQLLQLFRLALDVAANKSLSVSYTANRCILTMLRTHDRTLIEVCSSSDESDWELYVNYIKTLEELISTKPKKIPFGITLQCASILHTCGLIMGKCHKALPDGRAVNDLDDTIFLLLQKDIQTLATGEPIKRKEICLKRLLRLRRQLHASQQHLEEDISFLLDIIMEANGDVQAINKLLDTMKKKMDEPKVFIHLMRVALQLLSSWSSDQAQLSSQSCLELIRVFGGWNDVERKFTTNHAHLWDAAKVAGHCKCFGVMYEILAGITSQVQSASCDCWIQSMIHISRSEWIIESEMKEDRLNFSKACDMLDRAINEQLMYQTAMKTFSTLYEPRRYQAWLIQLRTEMLTLIKNTLNILLETQNSEGMDNSAKYLRFERKIMTCAKGWRKLTSRYRFFGKTISCADRQTLQIIEEFKIIALTFEYSMTSLKRSVFNCIDPALIPLFDDAAMLDEDMVGKQTTRTMSVQVIKDTIEWNDIPDSDLAARINSCSTTFESYCFNILRQSLALPNKFFSHHKNVTVQMSVEPSLEELQPLVLESGVDMLIKFEGVVQVPSQNTGYFGKAVTAEIVCFSTSQPISNMGDQMQVGMIYDDPVQTLKELGESGCLVHAATVYRANIVNSYFSTMGLVHFPQIAGEAGAKRQPGGGGWVNVLVRLVDETERVWITGPRYSRRAILQ
ncbi:hypothetical protein NQZ79_g4156 [Umbelopsis isabellina]|nr:hypothetical protein NQZ79_g4156 [Umbelopsis isabellina]